MCFISQRSSALAPRCCFCSRSFSQCFFFLGYCSFSLRFRGSLSSNLAFFFRAQTIIIFVLFLHFICPPLTFFVPCLHFLSPFVYIFCPFTFFLSLHPSSGGSMHAPSFRVLADPNLNFLGSSGGSIRAPSFRVTANPNLNS